MSDLRALEHSTLKVPYEILNKKFRVAQKTIDRESSHVNQACSALLKLLAQEPAELNTLRPAVQALCTRVDALSNKTAISVAEETEAAAVIKKRIEHLKFQLNCDRSGENVAKERWKQLRIDRLIVEYLLRSGYYETALQLAEKCGIEYMSNLGVFLSAREVEESLGSQDATKCLEWCYDNRSKLRRLRSRLELRVRQQVFIEMVREGDRSTAVAYARKYFSTAETDQWDELKSIMGILAFGPSTQIASYRALFSPSRWFELIKLFREENYRLYQLAHQSVFSACLQSGLSALKTPHCGRLAAQWAQRAENTPRGDPTMRKKECPVCLPDVRALADHLPYAHASQSRLICHVTGEPLNEHNPPMMLPNGMVYGQNALEKLALQGAGKITCPRTGLECGVEQVVRVYVM